MKASAFLAFAAMVACGGTLGAECTGRSPAHTVALVELYTSEGCSDCPPADRWLGGLAARAAAGSVVPLALHVDYWDYIGWKDPFARAAFSARQRELSSVQGRSFVYTPQVMLGGRDYRGWSTASGFDAEVKRINSTPARASIVLTSSLDRDGVLEAKAEGALADPKSARNAALYLAVTESGLSNQVSAGENRGATLRHDAVARSWAGPVGFAPGKPALASVSTRLSGAARRGGAGIVAFVQDRQTGEILQSFTVPACTGESK